LVPALKFLIPPRLTMSLKKKLLDEWNDGAGILGHYPMRRAWSVETAQNGPSIAAGVVSTRQSLVPLLSGC